MLTAWETPSASKEALSWGPLFSQLDYRTIRVPATIFGLQGGDKEPDSILSRKGDIIVSDTACIVS